MGAYSRQEWDWITKAATMAPSQLLVTTGIGTGMTPETSAGHRPFLKSIERIASRGGSIMATPMMRMGGLNFNLASRVHPMVISKTFRKLEKEAGQDVSLLARKMQDPIVRTTILAETEALASTSPLAEIVLGKDARWFVFPWSQDYEPKREDCLAAVAERQGKSMLELCYDVLSNPDEPHAGVLWRPLYSYGAHSMEMLKEMVLHPQVVPGFGDGGAHMKMLCDATTPTTMMTHWCRDRTRGEGIPLEVVVRKQTAETAAMLGFTDRGELRAGMKADINIIDLGGLNVMAPEFVYDLPMGAGRWKQAAVGYRLTLCSGVITFKNGIATGALPGRIAKNPKATGIHGGLQGTVPHAHIEGVMSAKDLKEHALYLQSQTQGFSALQKTLNAAVVSSKL